MRRALLSVVVFSTGCFLSHGADGSPACGAGTCAEHDVCCATCDGAGACQTADLPCPELRCGGGCVSSAECGAREYCALPLGICDRAGECAPVPGVCTDDCPGVCGCDGREYCNACEASVAGTSVSRAGPCDAERCGDAVCAPGVTCCPLCFGQAECIGTPDGACPDVFCPADCARNEDCGPEEYCAFAPGECGPGRVPGECVRAPNDCTGEGCAGVCGCDGAFYCNACLAMQAGTNPDPAGACSRPCGRGGAICEADEYCDLGAECGALDAQRCRSVPDACDAVFEPVCGCDGRTYGSPCEARAAGVTVASGEPCPEP